MKKSLIVTKIVNTYPDHIVCCGDELMLEDTLTEFAEAIMEDMNPGVQKGVFGQVFADVDDCYSYLLNDLPGLEEECQEFIWDKMK